MRGSDKLRIILNCILNVIACDVANWTESFALVVAGLNLSAL